MAAKMEPGTYQCKTTAATILEAPSGAVMCRIALDIGLTGGICLVQKDGTLSERGFRDAAAILGIEGGWNWDAWSADPESWAGHDVDVVVETLDIGKGEFSSVKYLNPPGGSPQHMEKADAKGLAAKYGAKTRALMGGTPAPATRKPPKPPVAPPKPSGKASTMEECWEEFCKQGNNGTKSEAELYDEWHGMIRKVTGKGQNDLTPEDWGNVFNTFDGLKM
jgi:hypothetical protein